MNRRIRKSSSCSSTPPFSRWRGKRTVLCAAIIFAAALAGAAAPAEDPLDALWRLPVLWHDDDADFLNEFRVTGRAHLDVFDVNANRGSMSDWDVRRLRAGARALLLHRLEFSAEVDFQPLNARPLYRRMTDAYVAWRFSDAARLCIGRQPVRFTLDGATSSNELLALDRNAIAASLWAPIIWGTGAGLNGHAGGWQYATGVFSGNSNTPEFASFRDGWYFLASAGYDFAARLGVKKALLRADYVHTEERPRYAGAYPFEDVASLSFHYDTERAGFSAEAAAGRGRDGTSDVFGVDCMRWWHLTPRFDAVLRFTWLVGDETGGIRLLRYDNAVSPFRGDAYTEFYGGVNWYLHGHQMKLQTGLSYSDLEDSRRGGSYRGWLWVSGLRLSW